jgi:ornithine cyclodeaminase/alanine dehydrogenase-like protein (mu-crystallin family)
MDKHATATSPRSAGAPPTLILTRGDIAASMTVDDYLDSAREAFLALGSGRAQSPMPLYLQAEGGGIHAKGALLRTASDGIYAAVKVNANFPGNPKNAGLPTIQGGIMLSDARNGCLLAVLDSIEVTLRRTAAASALAARHLARPDSAVLTICGCGGQSRPQLAAYAGAFDLRRVFAWDADPAAIRGFCDEVSEHAAFAVEPITSLREATAASDMIVTCTTACTPYLGVEHVRPGTFVAGIGADSTEKSELQPQLLARASVVVDGLEQCAQIGDLHHAIAAGAMTASDVHATLAEVVAGSKPGRRSDAEITVFDSTGMAVLDVAAAVRIYELACARGVGLACRLSV